MSTLAEFTQQLADFGVETEANASRLFRQAAQTAAEAIVVGNQYGPGAPVDTGFLRASFRARSGAPESGPSTPPPAPPGRVAGSQPLYPPPVIAPVIATAPLDRPLYITTTAAYGEPLELLGRRRRFGPQAGQSTAFVRPVEVRWERLVDDTARRLGLTGGAA